MSKSKNSLSAQIVSTTSPAAGKNVLSELYEPMKKGWVWNQPTVPRTRLRFS